MEKSVDFFYGTSLGSINPCLKKLAQQGFCCTKELQTGKRKSIEYRITKRSEQAFDSWLASKLKMGRVKDDSLVKLFFLGHLPKKDILHTADQYIAEIDQALMALQLLDQHNQIAIKDITLNNIQKMRLETLRFGIDYMTFAKQWYQDFKKRI